jgi:competence protein ComFC
MDGGGIRLKKFKARAKKALVGFVDWMFPKDVTCDLCGGELVAKTRYNLCAGCLSELPRVLNPCAVCGTEIADEASYCIRCQNTESRFSLNRAPLLYEGAGAQLVLSLKYGGNKYIADTLAAMMADVFIKENMAADLLVFVPMTKEDRKKRGFNQSELLAKRLGERLNLPVIEGLLKIRQTPLQKNLTAKERAENLSGAFIAVPHLVSRSKILLVDDVFTTGSTANECAKTLLKAGAQSVSVLCAAVTKQKILLE